MKQNINANTQSIMGLIPQISSVLLQFWSTAFKPAMSNPTGLRSQKLYYYLNQVHTLNDILMRAARCMAYFDLSKLNLYYDNVLKAFES